MRCPACPGTNACLGPDGPTSARILFVGEAPGKDENKKGRVFIGKIGQEVDYQYLPLAGLKRSGVCFTNAISCLPTTAGGKLDPKRKADVALLETCAGHHLVPLIEQGQFELIVPMGAFACLAVCPDVNLEVQHGIPTDSMYGIPAYPMYHPALGIHEPKRMLLLRNDWMNLKKLLRGKYSHRVDPYPEPDYAEVVDPDEILSMAPTRYLGIDTEYTRKKAPFCLTFSAAPGTGRLIRAGNTRVLGALQSYIERVNCYVVVHNLFADAPVLRQMGLRIRHALYLDTMAEIFHLGILPQGLKAVAFRELGVRMKDFEDVVGPYSRRLVIDYYRRAQQIWWPKPEPEMVWDNKVKGMREKKPHSMNTKLKTFFTYLDKNPDKDVFEAWTKNWVNEQAMIEECMEEEWPGMCVTHAPFEDILPYACRDADVTRRMWVEVLLPMRARSRKFTQEMWRP